MLSSRYSFRSLAGVCVPRNPPRIPIYVYWHPMRESNIFGSGICYYNHNFPDERTTITWITCWHTLRHNIDVRTGNGFKCAAHYLKNILYTIVCIYPIRAGYPANKRPSNRRRTLSHSTSHIINPRCRYSRKHIVLTKQLSGEGLFRSVRLMSGRGVARLPVKHNTQLYNNTTMQTYAVTCS